MSKIGPAIQSIGVILVGFAVFSTANGLAQTRSPIPSGLGGRHFRVADSIQMTRFAAPHSPAQFSPDHRYFAVVTSRGIIESDKIESTLWIFRSSDVRKFLHGHGNGSPPVRQVVARIAAVPQGKTFNIYDSMISDVRWAADSKTIFFLGKGSGGKHILYKAETGNGLATALTSPDRDVVKFDVAKDQIVYSTDLRRAAASGEPITGDARDVSGLSLESILFKEVRSYPESELWVLHKGRSVAILDPATRAPLCFWNYPPMLSLSPDGHFAVVVTAKDEVPASWNSYEPALPYLSFDTNDPNLTGRLNYTRPSQYSLVDLRRGALSSLLDAPLAWTAGYNGARRIVWSPSGNKVLLTQTFLPLNNGRNTRPCAVAVVDLTSKAQDCVTFVRPKAELSAASFTTTDKDIVLRFTDEQQDERYHDRDGRWEPIDPQAAGVPPSSEWNTVAAQDESPALLIEIKQDLNSPPVLWATERNRIHSREIWNPNPQLSEIQLGEASIFRWKDPTGHEWIGGLVKPPDYSAQKRYPLVIQTHGFREWEFMSDGQTATAFAARALAAAGIVVLQVADRLDHQVTAQEASEHVLGYISAIDQLASAGLIDRDKVGIIGFSRTCYYVETAIIQSPDRFKAAVIADGVDESYLQQLLFFTVSQASGEAEEIYGGPPLGKDLSRWMAGAPGFHVDQIQTPVQIQAIGPYSVLMEWEIYSLLWRQRGPSQLVYIPDGQHLLQKPRERIASQQGSVDWFRFWLKNEEDSDPTSRQKYVRWREMRRRKMKGTLGH